MSVVPERIDSLNSQEAYSPERRTALVLIGVGTAGAYHAGVLRALHEAGVKLDVVAGRGIGAVGALFAAIDGTSTLWSEKGVWRSDGVRRFYEWCLTLRIAAAAVAVSLAVVVVPLVAVAAGLIVYPIDFAAHMMGLGGASGLVGVYLQLVQDLFAPGGFPTWLPRIVVLVLGGAVIAVVVAGVRSVGRRRRRGPVWWRAALAPLSTTAVVDHCWRVLWDLLRGAAHVRRPPAPDLAQRYVELLVENIGQPGFRELLIVAHDLDAQRDLVFALMAETRRRDLIRRASTEAADARRAEVIDLAGVARAHLADAIAGALAVPVATEPHLLTFAPDAYWRGETHRVCDRPSSLLRILEELAAVGVEQAVVVSAAPEGGGPHQLAAGRLDGRGRIGEFLQSSEAASISDLMLAAHPGLPRLFAIRPAHNPIGPFDFGGGFDDRSDRRQPLVELMTRGYEDAFYQFVEPVVGASGERVGMGGA